MTKAQQATQKTLEEVLSGYRTRAIAAVQAARYLGDFDIPELHLKASRVLGELQAAAKDGTPTLFQTPESEDVAFVDVLTALSKASVAASTKPEYRKTPSTDDTSVTTATAAAEKALRRLMVAINGTDANTTEATDLRKAIRADRPTAQSKAGWETELNTIIAAIKQPTVNATPAVKAVVPRLEAALAEMQASVPQAGRKGKPFWTTAALEPAAALDLAVSAFLSWAGAHATDARLLKIQGAVTPRRRAEDAKDEGEGEEKAPARGTDSTGGTPTPTA